MHPRLRPAALLAVLLALPSLAFAQGMPHGLQRAYMDTTCAPCRDFYRYSNGAWIDKATIPPSYNVVGAAREIADRNQEALKRVLDRVGANAAKEKDPTLKKLGDLYNAAMDSTRADKEGAAPIQPELQKIAAINSKADLINECARLTSLGMGRPFRFGREPDRKNSTQNIGQVIQGGLSLPERDYYFRTDPKSDTTRRALMTYMSTTFQLLGDSPDQAADAASRVFKLETALAESSMTRVAMRDPQLLYHKITVKELGALTPGIDWNSYFTGAGVPSLASPDAPIDVSTPKFMRQVAAQLDATPLATWKDYLRWSVANEAAPWLGSKFFDANFAYQSVLNGQKVPQPRWKRAAAVVDGAMGEALGRAYVQTEFPPSSKKRMVELVNNLQAAYAERINAAPWMSAETKAQALKKLNAILKKIGYPDTWRDYTALNIDPKAPIATNLANARAFETKRRLDQIGKPVDRTEWGMTPPTVNAYYNPSVNEIVFPAGILQPPQFDPAVDDAVNYGAIGMVIGHEITHGFDDQGRQFDAVGNLTDWWTADDAKNFKERAQKVVDEYNGFVAIDTLHVNGQLTLGENIADLGGLTIAYHAWERSLKGKPHPKPIDGFTAEQRFFLGYSQAWRRKVRDESLRTQVLTDPHSPAIFRVNGPIQNMKEFQDAFHCKAGDAMVAADNVRAVIW